MANQTPKQVSPQGIAIVTGSFLSGAMMALSLMAVPVFLETTDSPNQLYHEWARTYHYGHQVLPALAVSTFALYGWAAFTRRAKKETWSSLVIAGVVTLSMVPFTWIFMVPTNNKLFGLEAESKAATAAVGTFESAQALITYWSRLHLTRSFFPLAGAAVGLTATLNTL